MGSTVSLESLRPLVVPSLRLGITERGRQNSKHRRFLGLGVYYSTCMWAWVTVMFNPQNGMEQQWNIPRIFNARNAVHMDLFSVASYIFIPVDVYIIVLVWVAIKLSVYSASTTCTL